MRPNGNGRSGGNGRSALTTKITYRDKTGRVTDEEDIVTYKGLLSMAHDDGLKRICTRVLQHPSEENGHTVVVHAEVETQKGIFQGIGDANPGNVNAKIRPHLIRMAETRAKARALRDAVNIGVVSMEELADFTEVREGRPEQFPVAREETARIPDRPAASETRTPTAPRGKIIHMPPPAERAERTVATAAAPVAAKTTVVPAPAPRSAADPSAAGSTTPSGSTSTYPEVPMSESQRRYLFRLLAERGVTGEDAHAQLKEALGVESLKDSTKQDASVMIDQLLRAKDQVESGEEVRA